MVFRFSPPLQFNGLAYIVHDACGIEGVVKNTEKKNDFFPLADSHRFGQLSLDEAMEAIQLVGEGINDFYDPIPEFEGTQFIPSGIRREVKNYQGILTIKSRKTGIKAQSIRRGYSRLAKRLKARLSEAITVMEMETNVELTREVLIAMSELRGKLPRGFTPLSKPDFQVIRTSFELSSTTNEEYSTGVNSRDESILAFVYMARETGILRDLGKGIALIAPKEMKNYVRKQLKLPGR